MCPTSTLERTEAPEKQLRYSFRNPDGQLPIRNGKLAWRQNRDEAETEAASWGAQTLLTLKENKEGTWDIIEESPIGKKED